MEKTRRVRDRGRRPLIATGVAVIACAFPAIAHLNGAAAAARQSSSAPGLPVPDLSVPPDRSVEPVVLTGADFPGWALPENTTVKAPLTDLADCAPGSNTDNCQHNRYVTPEVDTSGAQNKVLGDGVAVDRLLGYRWTGKRFVQIPFQIRAGHLRPSSNRTSQHLLRHTGRLKFVEMRSRFVHSGHQQTNTVRSLAVMLRVGLSPVTDLCHDPVQRDGSTVR